MAHDFNNLLTGISGSLGLMRMRTAQGRTAEIGRYIEIAMTSVNRAAALTHRLLAFSRRQTLDPKPTNVNRLVGGMEELFIRTVGPAIQVETNWRPTCGQPCATRTSSKTRCSTWSLTRATPCPTADTC